VSTGVGGNYLIHVINSDSTPTTEPYMLEVQQTPPVPPPPCPAARSFQFAGQGQAGALPSLTASPGANTLILVDYKRYGDTFGLDKENALKTKLQALAANSAVNGVIVPVEGSSAVQSAYNAWDTQGHSCLPDFANAVVKAIETNVIDPFRATHGNVKFLVIVGGDDIIPFPRVPDLTTTSNERDYVGTIGYPNSVPKNNELVGTAVASFMQTDAVWTAFDPAPFLLAPSTSCSGRRAASSKRLRRSRTSCRRLRRRAGASSIPPPRSLQAMTSCPTARRRSGVRWRRSRPTRRRRFSTERGRRRNS
jgi:hypothetical protein